MLRNTSDHQRCPAHTAFDSRKFPNPNLEATFPHRNWQQFIERHYKKLSECLMRTKTGL